MKRITRAKAFRLLESFNRARRDRTTLAWVVEHGADALPLAWAQCRDSGLMEHIARRLGMKNVPSECWTRTVYYDGQTYYRFQPRRSACKRLRRFTRMTVADALRPR